jgi:DNA-binding NtrC family response regulator
MEMAKKVLIVDDDLDTCELIGMHLAQERCEVVSTRCGEEALKLIDAEDFDLVLVDVFIPRVNGQTILDHVKRKRPDMKVVMITGMGDDQLWIDLMNKGAADVIAKPFRPRQLARVVERFLDVPAPSANN